MKYILLLTLLLLCKVILIDDCATATTCNWSRKCVQIVMFDLLLHATCVAECSWVFCLYIYCMNGSLRTYKLWLDMGLTCPQQVDKHLSSTWNLKTWLMKVEYCVTIWYVKIYESNSLSTSSLPCQCSTWNGHVSSMHCAWINVICEYKLTCP